MPVAHDDDSPGRRRRSEPDDLAKGYLEREGFTVATASDGPSAVDAARALRPDLVVLELMLPGFDGLEVCRRLRQFTDAYVLMLIGDVAHELRTPIATLEGYLEGLLDGGCGAGRADVGATAR